MAASSKVSAAENAGEWQQQPGNDQAADHVHQAGSVEAAELIAEPKEGPSLSIIYYSI